LLQQRLGQSSVGLFTLVVAAQGRAYELLIIGLEMRICRGYSRSPPHGQNFQLTCAGLPLGQVRGTNNELSGVSSTTFRRSPSLFFSPIRRALTSY
jgi:hypothetical protein